MKQLKFILLAVFFVSGVSLSHAQTEGKRTKVKVNRNVMMADELVKSGSYYNAIDIYLQEFNEDADPYVAYHLADAYLKARDYKNSETWFKKAFTMDEGYRSSLLQAFGKE
jgi:tetratricopeptide (TPR) repeat protein